MERIYVSKIETPEDPSPWQDPRVVFGARTPSEETESMRAIKMGYVIRKSFGS